MHTPLGLRTQDLLEVPEWGIPMSHLELFLKRSEINWRIGFPH
jgi:hypothetical protein